MPNSTCVGSRSSRSTIRSYSSRESATSSRARWSNGMRSYVLAAPYLPRSGRGQLARWLVRERRVLVCKQEQPVAVHAIPPPQVTHVELEESLRIPPRE